MIYRNPLQTKFVDIRSTFGLIKENILLLKSLKDSIWSLDQLTCKSVNTGNLVYWVGPLLPFLCQIVTKPGQKQQFVR